MTGRPHIPQTGFILIKAIVKTVGWLAYSLQVPFRNNYSRNGFYGGGFCITSFATCDPCGFHHVPCLIAINKLLLKVSTISLQLIHGKATRPLNHCEIYFSS